MGAAMKRKRQTGYAIILTTIGLTALLAFMGFGIDMGMLRYERRLQQTAADAAAIAGTNDLADICLGVSAGCASRDTAAQNAATANGFTDGSNNVTVAVNNPPSYWAGDPHLGDAKYVEVVITAVHQTYFERIVGIENETVVARAEATWNAGGSNSSECLVTLGDPSNEVGVDVQGSITLNATKCGIVDNGFYNHISNGLTINTCSFNVSASDTGGIPPTCNGQPMTPSYNSPTAENPLFKLNSETPCGFSTCNPASSPASPNTSGCNGATYCCPGGATVCSFQSVSINGGTVTFAPGVYIVDGGGTTNNPGFNCSGNPSISGNGVMFFFTGAATITCTGDGAMNLNAPSMNGAPSVPANLPQDWNGVLMWQDPADTSTGNLTAQGKSCAGGKGNSLGPSLGGDTGGNSSINGFDGVLYFPADQLWFYGNTHGSVNGLNVAAAVSDSLCMTGNADINFVGLTGPGVGPLLSTLSNAVLVE
jgi:hypothetical protein